MLSIYTGKLKKIECLPVFTPGLNVGKKHGDFFFPGCRPDFPVPTESRIFNQTFGVLAQNLAGILERNLKNGCQQLQFHNDKFNTVGI